MSGGHLRIAYLTSCAPIPTISGHSLRVHALWRAFAGLGEVRVFAFDCRPDAAARRGLRADAIRPLPGRRERGSALALRHLRAFVTDQSMLYAKAYSARRLERLRAELLAWHCDLLVIGDTWLADLLPQLRQSAAHVVIDTHNVESRLYARIAAEQPWPAKLKYLLFARNVRRLERQLAAADAAWAVSAADALAYRRELGLHKVAVVPNGIDTGAYTPGLVPPEPGTIVFTGTFGYWPNATAALHLIGLSGRLEAAGVAHRMLLVGRDPTPAMLAAAETTPGVTITGPVPDVRPFIARAALVAAPLTSGSGTKYKVLEALALGRPVVATAVGAEGLDLRDGVDAAVVPDLAAFDARVEAYLRRPETAEGMAAAGRRWVVETHSLHAVKRSLRSSLDAIGVRRAATELVE